MSGHEFAFALFLGMSAMVLLIAAFDAIKDWWGRRQLRSRKGQQKW